MLFKNKFFYALAIVLALSFSVLAVGPAYADGDAPEVEPTATEQPVEEVDTPQGTEEVPPASEEEAPAEEAATPASEEITPLKRA